MICAHHRWNTKGGVYEETCEIDPDLVDIVLSCDESSWCPYYKPKFPVSKRRLIFIF